MFILKILSEIDLDWSLFI